MNQSLLKSRYAVFTAGSFALVAAAYYGYSIQSGGQTDALYLQNANYTIQTGLFDKYKTARADIVMLGNSLTAWVSWNELLGRKNIANRGIAGDITEGYLHRMEQIYRLKPKLCFVEGGINDLYANVSVDVVFKNYEKIVENLRLHKIIPIIQSTLFVSPKWHSAVAKNKEVTELNSLLQSFSKKNNIEFINLNATMSTNNQLHDDLTYDGVHLTAKGYSLWGAEVDRALKKHGL